MNFQIYLLQAIARLAEEAQNKTPRRTEAEVRDYVDGFCRQLAELQGMEREITEWQKGLAAETRDSFSDRGKGSSIGKGTAND